jgi:phosphoribosylformylglycinamidine synthase subunit PurQ / glutaminase
MARVGVIVFPGSCDEADALGAVNVTPGLSGEYLWHRDSDLRDVDAVVIPGGFSYGDYLRPGAIARFSPVMEAVAAFAREGRPVLGICNGFQVLCEAGLLPGALLPNAGLRFVCRQVPLTVERVDTHWTAACEAGEELSIPVKHSLGRYFAPPEMLEELEDRGQVVLRYRSGRNPNGSVSDIAGVVNEQRNVFGLMPHPEHAVDRLEGSEDGARIFASLAQRVEAVPA